MRIVRYSALAEDDLYDVALYTVKQWSVEQADRYIAGIEEFCELIARFPAIGRECTEIAPRLRRIEHKSHVIFFYPTEVGIRISRIFHKTRDISDAEFDEFA